MRSRHPILVGWLCLALVAAACSRGAAEEPATTSSSSTSSRPTTTTSTTTTTVVAGPASPLNGLPAEDPDLLERGVMAVKIDNHWDARPQSGLLEADAVYELLVEAGLTRFIALFHDNDTDYLGPVRSGRPTDAELLLPLEAPFAISGAAHWVQRHLVGAGVRLIGEGPGMFRIRTRRAPHNLYADTAGLREVAAGRGYPSEPPPDLLPWGEWEEGTGEPADEIALTWAPGNLVRWEWDGERYVRFNGEQPHEWVDAEGEGGQLAADTLVVIFARRYTARPPRPSDGNPVPAEDTLGSGRALVFAGGRVIEGTWSRDDRRETFQLTDDEGSPLTVPTGFPWISIFPADRSVEW